jgi:hypothetical protein
MMGTIALGLVWGWLGAPLLERGRRWHSIVAVGCAVVLQGVVVAWMVRTQAVWYFALSWAFGLLLHRAIRSALGLLSRARFTS